jgi:hypothetical protein
MQKNAVIFADQEQQLQKTDPANLTLSREELRGVIQKAYKEGINDAQKENKTQTDKQQAIETNSTAKKEAIKSEEQKRQETKQKFKNISARNDLELFRAKTVFPFNFFPDTLVIDTTKITVSRKQFFATEFVTTIPLKDIADVTLQTALFLASLTFQYMPQSNSPGMMKPVIIRLNSLTRSDAIRAKNILKGVMVAKAEDIDISKLSAEEVVNVIEQFGQSESVV